VSKKGKLFVISAPSGSGKTTLCQRLIKGLSGRKRKLVRSVSATTRKPRKGERQGRDYFFIAKKDFIQRRGRHQFLEWAKVLDNFYGTPREFVKRQIDKGNDVLLSIDVQGARKLKRLVKDTPRPAFNAVFIFILPPSFKELARRLRLRSTESKTEIERRLKLAKKELAFLKEYDHVVINDKINRALICLKEIIQREREK
jgi:guanylate kinase